MRSLIMGEKLTKAEIIEKIHNSWVLFYWK